MHHRQKFRKVSSVGESLGRFDFLKNAKSEALELLDFKAEPSQEVFLNSSVPF